MDLQATHTITCCVLLGLLRVYMVVSLLLLLGQPGWAHSGCGAVKQDLHRRLLCWPDSAAVSCRDAHTAKHLSQYWWRLVAGGSTGLRGLPAAACAVCIPVELLTAPLTPL